MYADPAAQRRPACRRRARVVIAARSAVQPPSGPQARADVEKRCHLAAALEAPRAAAPRAPQPIWLRRAARGWAALRTPSCVLLAVGDAQHAALLAMIEALPSS